MESIPEENVEEKEHVYNVVFIGGGPSTLGFFSYLIKNSKLTEFTGKNSFLVVEKGKSFGSGCLGKYLINTNTSAQGFLRLIQDTSIDKPAESKQSLSPPKRKVVEPKNKIQCLDVFNKVLHSTCTQMLEYLGVKVAPLVVVGQFLSCVGNAIAAFLSKSGCKEPFYFNSEVVDIEKRPNFYRILIRRTTKEGCNSIWVKTKKLVMATGGKQRYRNNWISRINSVIPQSNLFNSDYFLQEIGYRRFHSLASNFDLPVITIVGGSHSAFSCAWLILNGFSTSNQHQGFKYQVETNPDCSNCRSDHCCLGAVKEYYPNVPALKQCVINILYRDVIKVYYSSEKDAEADGYMAYKGNKCKNKNGAIYPFIGLRGDAKELYRKVINGKEPRIRLVKSINIEQIEEFCKNSTAVVWACGYNTNEVSIKDEKGFRMKLLTEQDGSLEVDKELRILDKTKRAVPGLYGIGQGYATFSCEIINGMKMRADSISLYNTVIAKKLFNSLSPSLFDKKKQETKKIEPKKVPVKKESKRDNKKEVKREKSFSRTIDHKQDTKRKLNIPRKSKISIRKQSTLRNSEKSIEVKNMEIKQAIKDSYGEKKPLKKKSSVASELSKTLTPSNLKLPVIELRNSANNKPSIRPDKTKTVARLASTETRKTGVISRSNMLVVVPNRNKEEIAKTRLRR